MGGPSLRFWRRMVLFLPCPNDVSEPLRALGRAPETARFCSAMSPCCDHVSSRLPFLAVHCGKSRPCQLMAHEFVWISRDGAWPGSTGIIPSRVPLGTSRSYSGRVLRPGLRPDGPFGVCWLSGVEPSSLVTSDNIARVRGLSMGTVGRGDSRCCEIRANTVSRARACDLVA